MRARLPRPTITPGRDGDLVRRARVALVRRLGGWHATVTGGALLMPVLIALDRLLPAGPLPAVRVSFGCDAVVAVDGAVARGALIGAGYEHREAETLAGALAPGGVFVDVGANVGLLTMLIARHRPDVRVWALEPVPTTANRLADNVSRAGLPGVATMRIAAGAAPGEVLIATTPDSAFAHRVTAADGAPTRCHLVPLDDVWRDEGRPRVDAIKIDVEGAESDVLAGARDLLTAHHPLLIVEAPTESAARTVTSDLTPYGYRRFYPRGVLPYNACFSVTS